LNNLSDTTICVVDCKNYDNAAKSIIHCFSKCGISFGKAIYFSDIKHYKLKEYGIDYIKINKISSSDQYTNFMIKEFPKHIETKFVLIVQHDGLIYKPEKWTDDFLKYDYIGASWPHSPKGTNNVGNGGFSLRSKAFIDKASEIIGDSHCDHAEDVFLCCTIYEKMIKLGFKYADIDTACKFSVEQGWSKTNDESFGFHLAASNYIEKHFEFREKIYNNLEKNWKNQST
jgi:hypothetical protein